MAGDRGTAATARSWPAPGRRCRAPAGRGIRRAAARRAASASMSRAVSSSTGSRRIATSFITSTVTPPSPTSMNGPNCGSSRTPRIISTPVDHLLHQEALDPGARIVRGQPRAPSLRARRAPRRHRAARARRRRPRSCGSPPARRSSPRPESRSGRRAPPPRPAVLRQRALRHRQCHATRAACRRPRRPGCPARPRGSGIGAAPRRSVAA